MDNMESKDNQMNDIPILSPELLIGYSSDTSEINSFDEEKLMIISNNKNKSMFHLI